MKIKVGGSMKSIFTTLLFLMVSFSALAADFNVRMPKYCRISTGNFQAFTEGATMKLIAANEAALTDLDTLAKQAAVTNADVTFRVNGSVLEDRMVQIPRSGISERYIVFLVFGITDL